MKRLAVLISLSGEGGVERMVLNLVEAFAAEPGLTVDLVLIREESRHLGELPAAVNLVRLGVRHSALAVLPLAAYLRRVRPDALLAAKDRAGRAALRARRLSGVPTRVVIRIGTTLSEALKGRGAVRRWLRCFPIRRLYGSADAIVAISKGVAEDVAAIAGLPPERIAVIRNPVVTPRLAQLAAEPLSHPWLDDRAVPVVMGMGRLTRQKGFATLVRAFAQLRRSRPARLLIVGEGSDRQGLLDLAALEGVAADVQLPGFQSNPYPWLAKARVFVLSSIWEGFGNVLAEAMALGTPVVATDCRSGPRELLADGRYGPLVPVGDAAAMARAIGDVLDRPPAPEALAAAVRDYGVGLSARRYREILGL